MRTCVAMACLAVFLLDAGNLSVAARPASAAALPYCRALAHAADAAAPNGPVFIRSYEPGPGETDLPGPLKTSAFAYDNALASIALTACGDVAEGARIADAFVARRPSRPHIPRRPHPQCLSRRGSDAGRGAAARLVGHAGRAMGRGRLSGQHRHRKCRLGGFGFAQRACRNWARPSISKLRAGFSRGSGRTRPMRPGRKGMPAA